MTQFWEVYVLKIALSLLQIIVCLVLLSLVMLQHRKSGGFSGMFGGGATLPDGSGSWQRMTGLNKATVVVTAVFMLLSLVLVMIR